MNKPSPLAPDFRTLFESVPGLYLVLLPDFTITAVSNAYLQATMTERDEILGRDLFDVFPDNPNDPVATGVSNLRASLQRVLKSKAPDTMAMQKYDIRRPASEGGGFEERFWSPVNYPVFGRNREIVYIIHRVEDVTEFVRLKQLGNKQDKAAKELKTRAERMEAEIFIRAQELQDTNKKLRDREIFLDSVVENLPNMIFVKEAKDLRFVLLNQAGEKLLGYPRADLIGKNDYDFFPKEQADFFVNNDRKVLGDGELLDIPEEPIQTRDHGKRFLHTRKIPILDSGGTPVYLLGISEDITERKAAEERFRGLLESAPDAMVIAGVDGRIQLVNAQTEKLFGYARAELIGKPIEILVPERFRASHVGHRDGYVSSPRTRPMGLGLDLYGRRKDGSEFPTAISLSSVGSDKDFLVFADIRDVTDQRSIEQQVRELNQHLERRNVELEAVNHELEAFSYSVSHDLRAPLRAIDGFSKEVIEGYADRLDTQGRNYLQRVRAASQHMGELIDDLLKLARVTRAELQRDEVDLSTLAQDILAEQQRREPGRRIETAVTSHLRVNADPNLMRVALENLLDNARKFTGRCEHARIEFGRSQQDGEAVFFVRDNGAGFDMAYADKLFGAFQRLHSPSEFEGTGIGLATVQRIIRRHGGRIWAQARVGHGAIFSFTLPS